MHKQSRIVLGWHRATKTLLARTKLVRSLVGILALIFLSAGQTVGAQQQNRKAITYDWIITGPPGNICFNEHVDYTVRVVRKIRHVEDTDSDTAPISSVTVGAKIADENIISSGNSRRRC